MSTEGSPELFLPLSNRWLQRLQSLSGIIPQECFPAGVVLLELRFPIIDGEEGLAAARVDVHVGRNLPRLIEGAHAHIRDVRPCVGVVAPQAGMTRGTVHDGLSEPGLGRDADGRGFGVGLVVGRGDGAGEGRKGGHETGGDGLRGSTGAGDGGSDRRELSEGRGLDDGVEAEDGAGLALARGAVAAVDEEGWLGELVADKATDAAAGEGEDVFPFGVVGSHGDGVGE